MVFLFYFIQTNLSTTQVTIQPTNKRRYADLNEDASYINQSFSQLTVSQQNLKRTKAIPSTGTDAATSQDQSQAARSNDETLPMNLKEYKSLYRNVSDKTFKRMLSQAVTDGDQLVCSIDTHEKLQFIRQITELTHNVYYFGFQRDLWQDYYNIGLKHGNVWAPRLAKSLAKQLHTCVTYGYPKHIIEKRQRTIQRQIEHTATELNQRLIELLILAQQWQPSIDLNLLSIAMNECVKSSQKRLRQEFDYRRKMLELDAHDHHFISKFYDSQPNEEQVRYNKHIHMHYILYLDKSCAYDMDRNSW